MNSNPELLQEQPLMEIPEYDVVSFDPDERLWRSHLPREWEKEWSRQLPLAYVPRTYSGITSGSERTMLRGPTDEKEGAPRPDLNIVFDQATYVPSRKWLVYFTGGLTAAYDVLRRRWTDLSPRHVPPPVLGGSLAYDPLHDEIVLFGGGHVAEPGPNGKLVGYTGTWTYRFSDQDWHRLQTTNRPPPRMNTRMVLDSNNQLLVLFGGDGQNHYLADTWLYDLKNRSWRASKASSGPEARAGHFTVFDPETGWVLIGGGYNSEDLTDMWAYDAAKDRWQKITGRVPTGFYISADIAPERNLIVLVTATRAPGDKMSCNVLYPVRTTYAYRIRKDTLQPATVPNSRIHPIPKGNAPEGNTQEADQSRRQAQAKRLAEMPFNRWVHLANPGRIAVTRTWGSATFDTDRGLILYWGGGHCGYGGNDVDAYDLIEHTWRSMERMPEYPGRSWDHGVRLAGVTFQGNPWTDHGRRIYSYDPVSRKMIMVRPIRLTDGYDPELLRKVPAVRPVAQDALVNRPSSYVKYTTWTYNPESAQWEMIGGAPEGLDTLVSTPYGVMGVNVYWPGRLNDAGYLLPWRDSRPSQDRAIYLLNVGRRKWDRLNRGGLAPQNLYEMTSLAYDSKRDQILLHGAGAKHDELWAFNMSARLWKKMNPKVVGAGEPPVCTREAVYIPGEDVFFIYGPAPESKTVPAVWAYSLRENLWRRVEVPMQHGIEREQRANQNRAMVYDPKHNLVLLVLGNGGDQGSAFVYAMRYQHRQ